MRRFRLRIAQNQKGIAMIVVLGVLLALSLVALMAIRSGETEMGVTGNLTRRTRAFLAAEAGLARADYIFKQNPNRKGADTLLGLINADTILPNAHFKITMDTTLPLRRVRATGFADEGEAAIQVLYRHGNNPVNIWNNAIFAGHGQDGISIKGNVGIHGSIHILGDGEEFTDSNGDGDWDVGEPYTDANHDGAYDPPLTPGQAALDMTGSATVSNNYNGLPAVLASRAPALPTANYGGETVQTIEAALRVKNGSVELSGNAKVGQPNAAGGSPAVKETMDGVYVTDGFTGSAASDGVYSDNGYGSSYDLEDVPVKMPDLDAAYTDKLGNYYPTYMNYLQANALVIPGDLNITAGTAMPFVSNGRGSISVDAAGNIVTSGIVYVQGNINISGGSALKYNGRAMFVSEKNVNINTDLYAKTMFPTTDVLGVVAHGKMGIGTAGGASQLNLQGAFFAQEEIINGKQNKLMGSIVSNTFGMLNVPDIYQVPALAKNLPPGMPGADDVDIFAWRRVPRSWVELE